MSGEPKIAFAEIADLDEVVRMVREFHSLEGIDRAEAGIRDSLEVLINDPARGRLAVICAGDEPAGYALLTFGFSLEYGGRDAFVDELYLRAEYRGRGWGRRALTFIEQEARNRGVKALHLEVALENCPAIELYRRFGFKDHGRRLMTKMLGRAGRLGERA